MRNLKIVIGVLSCCVILLLSFVQTVSAAEVEKKNEKIEEKFSVAYNSHVQDLGWEKEFSKIDGQESGTTGKNLKNEAIKIKLVDAPKNVNIEYQVYVKDIGWQEWKKNGEEAGTTGKNKIMEAIKIRLTGTENYSVEYRTHLENYGWMEWKKDEEIAGAVGKGLKMEAIQIRIVSKTDTTVLYQSHVQDIGWQKYYCDGETSGIANKGLKIEAVRIELKDGKKNINIKYQSHVQDLGWEKSWKNAGEQSGTTGKNLKVEAIQIKLEGTEQYSITYRTYIQDRGWQEWANDGEISGTTGKNLKVEAIEIKIMPKIKNKVKMCVDTMIPDKIGQEQYKIKGWLMTDIKNAKIQLMVNDKIENIKLERTERADVLETIKGYGGQDKNPKPGYEMIVDFSAYKLEKVNLKVQVVSEDGKILDQQMVDTEICPKIEREEGTYGVSGQKVANKGGSELPYLKYGKGKNVFFAVFALHGYEDIWDKDGKELVNIANDFYNKLMTDKDYDIYNNWTIYVFPGVNQDGLKNGWTNNGPGRTTLYSEAPQNKGIDMNRCWQVGENYTRYTSDRNYNGEKGFQAYEAKALRDFLIKNKSQNGQTILVDLHGWTQQLIGDVKICSYYEKQFPENNKSGVGRYGTGYLVNWARTYLGSSAGAAKSALIELPKAGVTDHQSVVDKKFSNRYITATLDMLKSIK